MIRLLVVHRQVLVMGALIDSTDDLTQEACLFFFFVEEGFFFENSMKQE